ncbi:MAG: XamI family restriction endonuclease [Nitrospirae bacterium]|nr:XamI family restriction endonuclease [Nitrospirota bacterium]
MAVNMDKPHLWKQDVSLSVDFYNEWFMKFAPKAYRDTRQETTARVEWALSYTKNLTDISPAKLIEYPEILPILRMATAPPIARDRLIGLASISGNLVRSMELKKRIPPRMNKGIVISELGKVGAMIRKLVDLDIFPWFKNEHAPNDVDVHRAATVVADRLCGAVADPIIRNAQEKRQLEAIGSWLEAKGYRFNAPSEISDFRDMAPLTFSHHLNITVLMEGGKKRINIPADVVIMPRKPRRGGMPLLVECKSAGDFTNTNKRRKEEAAKIKLLRANYGNDVSFVLFLCGYFDSGYLGYEAAEGLDWVWEHRIHDLSKFGV